MALIDKPDTDVDRLTRHLKGPDFPTGGIIVGRDGIREAYRSGRGRIVVRARAIEELRGGRTAIVVTELPYQASRKAATRASSRRSPTSSRTEEAQRDRGPARPLGQVRDARRDPTQARRHPAGRPQQALQAHAAGDDLRLQRGRAGRRRAAHAQAARPAPALPRLPARGRHRRSSTSCARRRSAHILEGYLVALDNLDEVIALIRGAEDTESARTALMGRFELSEIQAQAILELRLRALTGLERTSLEEEYRPTSGSASASCARSSATPLASTRSSARSSLEIRGIYGQRRPPNGDRRRRGRAVPRGHDRRGGHGHRDHAVGLHQAATGDRVPRAAPRRDRRDGHGPARRRLHRAPLHRVHARLRPLLHLRREGLPAEGARASARHAAVEGPRDRQPAAVPSGRADPRRRPDARLQARPEYLVFATKKGVVKKSSWPTTTPRSRPTGSSRSTCATATSSSACGTRPARTT